MPRLIPVTSEKMCKILEGVGFRFVRQKGSHVYFKHPDGRASVVPMHKGQLKKGLQKAIIKEDMDISIEEFDKLRTKV